VRLKASAELISWSVLALFAWLGPICPPSVAAGANETAFINGKVILYDKPAVAAILVRDGRIAALGETSAIKSSAASDARVIDLKGREVIPGLIDSHIHAIRAGLTYTSEASWIGVRSLDDALDRIRIKASHSPKGSWIVVAGGWTENQFAEQRAPTQAEITSAAPDNPVYVQLRYSRVLLSVGGYHVLGIATHPDLAGELKQELDQTGKPTGWVSGSARAISDLYDLLPRPDFATQVDGTRKFFRELNASGLTGVLDPGGYNMPVRDYGPLFSLWHNHQLSLRVRYSLCAPRANHELEDYENLLAMLPMGFGDDWLRFNGIGENVTWGMYNNDQPTAADKEQLYQVLSWAAARRMTATFHWNNEASVASLLEVLERVNKGSPIAGLRWSIAHLNDASDASLRRMKSMGVGWLVQDALFFRGLALIGQKGLDAGSLLPPMHKALEMEVAMGGGTDAHRVMWYQPFVALQWMIDGKTVEGIDMSSQASSLDRMEALKLYTQGSAWFSFEEHERGGLEVGSLADLVVLNQDYLTVPTDEIGSTKSLLTMVGGHIVYAAGPFSRFDELGSREPEPSAADGGTR
jgi:predicted amidohydrolase YtcJ